MMVALRGGPKTGSGHVALVDSTSQRSVAETVVSFCGNTVNTAIVIPEDGLPAETDYMIVARAEKAGKRRADTCSARAIHADRLSILMELEKELLFSSSRLLLGTESDTLPGVSRALALVQASLEQKLRDNEALDSATSSFERLLGRMRKAAGFADATPWHDPGLMPWAAPLCAGAPIIQRELAAALADAPESKWESADYEAIAPAWRVRHLWQGGEWLSEAAALFPDTIALLKGLEAEHGLRLNSMQNVACGIARQPAGSGIAPHCDGNVLGLTCHLGLRVPSEGCWIEVGGERRHWKERSLLLMDTTFVHRTGNDSGEDRYVLMLNVLRPGVSEPDTHALQRHLSAPPLRLDSFNPSYVWLPRSNTGSQECKTRHPSLASAEAGNVFAAVSPATEVAPSERAVEVAPGTWLPLRHADETQDGLATIVPLHDQTFTMLEPSAYRDLPTYGTPTIGPQVAKTKTVRPDLGLLDEEGYLAWIGFWNEGAASLMQPPNAPAKGDELDVPLPTLRQHLQLLRQGLQTHSRWLPFETADGSPLLRELSADH